MALFGSITVNPPGVLISGKFLADVQRAFEGTEHGAVGFLPTLLAFPCAFGFRGGTEGGGAPSQFRAGVSAGVSRGCPAGGGNAAGSGARHRPGRARAAPGPGGCPRADADKSPPGLDGRLRGHSWGGNCLLDGPGPRRLCVIDRRCRAFQLCWGMNRTRPMASSWEDDGAQTGLAARFEEEIRIDRELHQSAGENAEGTGPPRAKPEITPEASPHPPP